jgi:hypothetical protein
VDDSLISSTKQMWKIWALAGLGIACAAAMGTLFYLEAALPLANKLLLSSLTFVAGGIGCVLVFTIRCPGCKARWLELAHAEKPLSGGWTWLSAQRVCPKCGKSCAQLALLVKPQQ